MEKFTLKDFRVGMVLTTKNGSKYVVVADDNGHHDVIRLNGDKPGNSNGLEINNAGSLAVCGGMAPSDYNGRKITIETYADVICLGNKKKYIPKTEHRNPYEEGVDILS